LEDDDQQGLAHFLEHMAFNGTKNFARQDIVNYLESIGMRFGPDINAYTSFDETVYMLQIPTDSLEIIEKAFLILSDWAHQISLESPEIEKERGVVIEEWRLGQGAQSRLRDKQFPILLKNSRYAERLPIGKKVVLDTFKQQTLQRFYKDWYRPDLMAVIAVGDFDPKLIQKLIEKNFNRIPARPQAPNRIIFPVPDHDQTLYAIAADSEATSSRISIYNKLPLEDSQSAGAFRNSIIERLYNRMLNERLSELTQSQDPPFIYAISREGQMIRSKNFYILSAMVKDNGIQHGLDVLLTEAKRIREFGFTQTELDRGKTALLRFRERQYKERDKTESSRFTAQYLSNFLYDNPLTSIEFRYELEKRYMPDIKLEEVNALSAKWSSEKSRVITVATPEKEEIIQPDEQALSAIISTVQNEKLDPYIDNTLDQPLVEKTPKAGFVVKSDYNSDLDITAWKLENGIRVILKPTDFKNDEIRMSAFSPGGSSLVPDSNLIAAESCIGILLESGLGNFDHTQLNKKLSGKIVKVSPYIGEISEGFSGFASPRDLKTLFQLVYLYFSNIRRDSTAFISFKKRIQGVYENRNASPEAAYYDTLTATLTQHHPRYEPWSIETLDFMDLDKSISIFKDRFADVSDFTFLFVGNFTPDSIQYLVETYLGGIKPLKRRETWKDKTFRYPRGIIKKYVYKGKEPKSQTAIVITGPFVWNREERHAVRSMVHMLRIKLRERLREDLGGTYSINANASFSHYPLGRYRIDFRFGCDPDRVQELTREIFVQIDSLKNFGMKEEYLNKVREIQTREYETNLKKNNFWISNIEFKYFHGDPPEDILNYLPLVNTLTMEKIRKVAKKYLNTENYVEVVLFPEKRN
jgi:zinc protease